MIYVQLKSHLPIEGDSLKATIVNDQYTLEHVFDFEYTNPDHVVMDPIGMVEPFLNQFEAIIRDQLMVHGLGIQLIVPISKTITQVIDGVSHIADDLVEYSVGFMTPCGNMFFTPAMRYFPEYKPKKGQPYITKFLVVDFNLFQIEQAYGMEVYSNYLTSQRFWLDLYRICIDQINAIPGGDNKIFQLVRRDIITFLEEQIESSMKSLEAN